MPIDDDYPGVGPFNFSWLPWFIVPALAHDQTFEDVRDGKLPPWELWKSNGLLFVNVLKDILNRSMWIWPFGIFTLVCSVPLILAWTLYRYTQAKLGIWHR